MEDSNYSIFWVVFRLNGSVERHSSYEEEVPKGGDGAHPNGVPVTVDYVVSSRGGKLDSGHDRCVIAKENPQ